MATIKLNDKTSSSAKNMLLLSNSVNIVTLENTDQSNIYNVLTLTIDEKTYGIADAQKEAVIKINNNTITATSNLDDVGGRRFYCKNGCDVNYAAITIVNALKSIAELQMNNKILQDGNIVKIIAIAEDNSIEIGNINGITVKEKNKVTYDNMVGADIYLDIYANEGSNIVSEENNEFVTTLQKKYFKYGVNFNISSILSTLATYNKTTNLIFKVYGSNNGTYYDFGTITSNYLTRGYLANNGKKYLTINQRQIAANMSLGDENRTELNKNVLYIYSPQVDFTMIDKTNDNVEVKIRYLYSDGTLVTQEDTRTISNSGIMTYHSIALDEASIRDSYFVDLQFPFGTVRYNVIAPPFSQEDTTRILFNNSYGGISFFDFVGGRKETKKVSTDVYNKSLLHYYDKKVNEQEIVYSKDSVTEVTLTTHLIEKDGTYIFDDMANAYRAWVYIDGVIHYIIIDAIDKKEISDNVFEVNVKYHYSLNDTFK